MGAQDKPHLSKAEAFRASVENTQQPVAEASTASVESVGTQPATSTYAASSGAPVFQPSTTPLPVLNIASLWEFPKEVDAEQSTAQTTTPASASGTDKASVDNDIRAFKREAQKKALLSRIDVAAVEQLAPEVTGEIFDKLFSPFADALLDTIEDERKARDEEVTKLRSTIETSSTELTKQELKRRENQINSSVAALVPDADRIISDPAFKHFLATTKAPFSALPIGVNLRDAYSQGDVDTIAKILGMFTQGNSAQTIDHIAGVEGSYVTPQPGDTSNAGDEVFSYSDMRQARRDVQTGKMSESQFKAFKKRYDAAYAAGRVK